MSHDSPILVTGANGLLGRHLLELATRTRKVHALVRRLPTAPLPDVQYHLVNLSTDWNAGLLPKHGIDSIVHLAQSAHFREVPQKSLDVFAVNVASTAKLLDYAWRTGVRRFVYASSGGVYGGGSGVFHENSPLTPGGQLGYYLGSKLCGEVLTQGYASHLQVSVLRFFFIYGKGQNRSMLIPRLVDSVREGRPINLTGPHGLTINPIHASDAAAAVLASLARDDSATYNIAGDEIISLRGLCEKIESLTGTRGVYAESPGVPTDMVGDISAMRAALHHPRVRLNEGLRDLL
jgi:UDP-glucose 4-epimerase